MTLPDPSYITADDVKSQSQITGLKTGSVGLLTVADINTLITAAEDQIDAYVGPQEHHPFDGNIDRVFPRAQDFQITQAGGSRYEYPDIPEIPYKVSRATLRQVEWLFTQWWTTKTTSQIPTDAPVSQRAIGGDGSYSETFARGGINFSEASVCDQAKVLLNGFVRRTVGIATTDPRTSPAPRRDSSIRSYDR